MLKSLLQELYKDIYTKQFELIFVDLRYIKQLILINSAKVYKC